MQAIINIIIMVYYEKYKAHKKSSYHSNKTSGGRRQRFLTLSKVLTRLTLLNEYM